MGTRIVCTIRKNSSRSFTYALAPISCTRLWIRFVASNCTNARESFMIFIFMRTTLRVCVCECIELVVWMTSPLKTTICATLAQPQINKTKKTSQGKRHFVTCIMGLQYTRRTIHLVVFAPRRIYIYIYTRTCSLFYITDFLYIKTPNTSAPANLNLPIHTNTHAIVIEHISPGLGFESPESYIELLIYYVYNEMGP